MDLHCTICVEEFDLKERKPVVFPCGHTYICAVCAKRLDECHICREPLFWHPPKPQHHAANNPYNNHHRSPAQARYARAYSSRYSPQTPPHRGAGAVKPPEKREKVPLPCPENKVLIEMIESKQRLERLAAEVKAERLRKKQEKLQEKQLKMRRRREEKENLRRGHHDNPERDACRPSLTQHYSSDSQEIEVDIDGSKNSNLLDYDDCEEEEFDDEISSSSSASLPLGDPDLNSGYAAISGTCGTYAVREKDGLVVLPQDPTRPKYNANEAHIQRELEEDLEREELKAASGTSSALSNRDDANSLDDGPSHKLRSSHSIKEPFIITEGQKVQVVGVLESNEHGVYQLAREAGFVVATSKQLVKVGGPEETSCKMEGMLLSLLEKQQETERKLQEIKNLANGLKQKIVLEQNKPEDHPVISAPIQKKSVSICEDEKMPSDANPKTPPRVRQSHADSPNGGSAGRDSVSTVNSTVVELGATPRTPSYSRQQQSEYVYSPAHSCPIPGNRATAVNLDQPPYLDNEAPASAGVLRYRVNNDDEASGVGWAGLMGCGTWGLVGERLLESSESGAANNIFNSANNGHNDILRLSDQLQQTNAQRRVQSLALAAGRTPGYLLENNGSVGSPLRRGGSFDGGGTVDFRSGWSHSSGLSRPKRDFSCDQNSRFQSSDFEGLRRKPAMSHMSQHRGVGSVRLLPKTTSGYQRRGSNPEALLACRTIR